MNPDQNGNVRVLWAFTDASGRRPFIPGKPNLDLAWQKGFGKWNARSSDSKVNFQRSGLTYPDLGLIYGQDKNTGGGCAGALTLATPTKIAYSHFFVESADHNSDSAAVIASHEIGHVLGLNHITDSNTPSIMNQPHGGTVEDQCINPLNYIPTSEPTNADISNSQTCRAQARNINTNQVGEVSQSNVFFTITYNTCSFFMSDWSFYDGFYSFSYSHPVIYGGYCQ